VLDSIEPQLAYEPTSETRNRKGMRPNPVAPWELRLGDLRVYFDVEDRKHVVRVLAVGKKDRNRVVIGGESVDFK
jgi:mRNA-degrading endonuclease RelE of RelBE toxin-antitoxin system